MNMIPYQETMFTFHRQSAHHYPVSQLALWAMDVVYLSEHPLFFQII